MLPSYINRNKINFFSYPVKIGQVTARLDARTSSVGTDDWHVNALFTFRGLADFHPEERKKARSDTARLLGYLEGDRKDSKIWDVSQL